MGCRLTDWRNFWPLPHYFSLHLFKQSLVFAVVMIFQNTLIKKYFGRQWLICMVLKLSVKISMAKLRMAHASTHGARKPPGPIVLVQQGLSNPRKKTFWDGRISSIRRTCWAGINRWGINQCVKLE